MYYRVLLYITHTIASDAAAKLCVCFIDPYAGSPTKTLLRLLVPTDKKICLVSTHRICISARLIFMSNGTSDGRCVQKAGT